MNPMKPTRQELEDKLLDALLHEQGRTDREQALVQIENALDAAPRMAELPLRSPWPRRLAVIAAAVALGCLSIAGIDALRKNQMAAEKAAQASAAAAAVKAREQERAALDKAIRDQEDKVDERRKVLATIGRMKGITYKGQDSFNGQNEDLLGGSTREESIKRGLDAQDYVDARREYDTDVRALADMKLRQAGVGGPVSSTRSEMAAAESVVEMKRRARLEPSRGNPAVVAEGSSRAVTIPNEGASFGEMSALSSLTPGNAAGGLAGGNLGGGFGRGAGTGRGYGMAPERQPANTERYGELIDPSWQRPEKNPLSTFSIDVDNASYSNIRRMIRDGQRIPADAVRIEECVNAFDYAYQKPSGNDAFAVHTALATCPWNEQHLLVKVGIKGREIAPGQRPASNLVFLIDISGSMQDSRKLPLVKESLKLLLHQLDERDSVSFVVYAGGQGVVLPPTKMTESGRVTALDALGKLEAGGSTNGGAGIQRAYEMAREGFVEGGVNRVILATDGDFNVGITDRQQLVNLVKERAAGHIYLSVLGFGTGNLNDSMLEAVSKDGNGNYYYIDSIREGRKVLLQKLSGTLVTIAKDVKFQIEFNPLKVGSYRLIGYANRVLKSEDFNNDKADAGDIGAGHTVTAFYEIVPAGAPLPNAGGIDPLKYQKSPEAEQPAKPAAGPGDEWLTLKLRHKHPEGDVSALQESVVKGPAARWQESGADFQFATAVALFGMKLRGMDETAEMSWDRIREIARPGLANDPNEDRAEFIGLLDVLEKRGN